jgi:hypothetical protein
MFPEEAWRRVAIEGRKFCGALECDRSGAVGRQRVSRGKPK